MIESKAAPPPTKKKPELNQFHNSVIYINTNENTNKRIFIQSSYSVLLKTYLYIVR
jgi:hypothetical protein